MEYSKEKNATNLVITSIFKFVTILHVKKIIDYELHPTFNFSKSYHFYYSIFDRGCTSKNSKCLIINLRLNCKANVQSNKFSIAKIIIQSKGRFILTRDTWISANTFAIYQCST